MKNVFYFGPVLCAVASLWGDLNAILSADEKKGGRPFVLSSSVLDFKQFVFYDNLFYAGFSGSKYTWCNNQFGISGVVARLDRVLFNSCWESIYDDISVLHLPRVGGLRPFTTCY